MNALSIFINGQIVLTQLLHELVRLATCGKLALVPMCCHLAHMHAQPNDGLDAFVVRVDTQDPDCWNKALKDCKVAQQKRVSKYQAAPLGIQQPYADSFFLLC
jgi:hypothetical protein